MKSLAVKKKKQTTSYESYSKLRYASTRLLRSNNMYIAQDKNVDKLQSLHLDNVGSLHGKMKRDQIEENGIFLFFTKAK